MRRSRSLWPAAKAVMGLALAVLLACDGSSQSRPKRAAVLATKDQLARKAKPAKPRPAKPLPRTALPLMVDSLPFQLERMTWFVLPGQALEISALLGPAMQEVTARAGKGRLEATVAGAWRYTAPDRPGDDSIHIEQADGKASADLRIGILIPKTRLKNGKLNGYEIGSYVIGHKNPIYEPPVGYYEVLGKNATAWLTPHVQMRDLVTKQIETYPRYLVTHPKLLVKLEAVLAELQKAGVKVKRFSFISGYRTPFYNAKIENVGLSRHQYGDAADVFIDNDGDGYMDDLNHDGHRDQDDAEYIRTIVNRMDTSRQYRHLSGGCGVYRPKGERTPFVHIDTRGNRARWVN